MQPSFRLDGKVAVVNGASRGIGRAIAIGVATAGSDVVLAGRSLEPLEEVAQRIHEVGRRSIPVQTDMRHPAQAAKMVDEAVAQFGRIDILVNAAGMAMRQASTDIREPDFDEVFSTNIKGITFACTAAGQHFISQGSGRIINIASLASIFGIPGRALYGASKGAIAQLTRALAVEWGPSNICVNAIAPGWIETDFTRTVLAQPDVRERIEQRTPLRRVGQPDDLVGLAIFLASPASAFLTGQIICLDGGYSAA